MHSQAQQTEWRLNWAAPYNLDYNLLVGDLDWKSGDKRQLNKRFCFMINSPCRNSPNYISQLIMIFGYKIIIWWNYREFFYSRDKVSFRETVRVTDETD